MTTTVSAISNLQSTAGASNTSAIASSNTSVSKDDFLKILISQLKHQDPLEPLKPDQFLTQLSQMTQVEQLQNITSALESMQKTTENNNITQWISTIGKKIQVDGNTLSKGDELYVIPSGDFDEVILTTKSLIDGGMEEVRFKKGEPLVYTQEADDSVIVGVSAVKGNKAVQCSMTSYRVVKGLNISDGAPVLTTGNGDCYGIDQVKQIKN